MKKIHQNLRQTILSFIDFFYPLFKKVMTLQTFRYAACGGLNTAMDIGMFFVAYNYIIHKNEINLHWLVISPHISAMLLAMCISLPVGFYLNRYVVFPQSGLKGRTQLYRYLLVVGINILLNYAFLKLFVEYFGWYPTLAKIAVTVIVIIFSYTSQTFYFFRQKPAKV